MMSTITQTFFNVEDEIEFYSDNDDEFEEDDVTSDWDDDDDDQTNDWNDVDIIDDNNDDDNILKTSTQNIISPKSNECWKCNSCSTINNVRLSIEKYNMECCGCHQTSYIPDETLIIYLSKWDTPIDYKLKNNLIKLIWICKHCTYRNYNIHAKTCVLCEQPKPAITKYIYANNTKYKSKDIIKQLTTNTTQKTWICSKCTFQNMYMLATQCAICCSPKKLSDIIDKTLIKSWKCDSCTYINSDQNIITCQMCNASNPSISKLISTANKDKTDTDTDTIVHVDNEYDEYIDINEANNRWKCTNCTSIQSAHSYRCGVCKCKRSTKYGFKYDRFLVFGFCREIEYFNDLFCIIPSCLKILCLKYYPMFGSKLICGIYNNVGYQFQSIKSTYIIGKYGRYTWKIKIKMNVDEIVNVDKYTNIIHDIHIGVKTTGVTETLKKGKIVSYTKTLYYFLKATGKSFISSNNTTSKYQTTKSEQYSRGFKYGDIVTMLFDYTAQKKELSFGINNDWYGAAFDNLKGGKFEFYVNSKQQGAIIELLN